jgi:hypothetical protein
MSIKTKNQKFTAETLNTVAMQAGLLLMTAAATVGMIELPEHPNKVAVNVQPAFAMVSDSNRNEPNSLRREREETAPHYISYSVTQRTPGRTGRI